MEEEHGRWLVIGDIDCLPINTGKVVRWCHHSESPLVLVLVLIVVACLTVVTTIRVGSGAIISELVEANMLREFCEGMQVCGRRVKTVDVDGLTTRQEQHTNVLHWYQILVHDATETVRK